MKQARLFKSAESAFGGTLFKTRKGRSIPRPLSIRHTMHLVLKSSKAKGEWSFRRKKKRIENILRKFARKNGIQILSLAIVGNHLHCHLKLINRFTYKAFIRAVTGLIATEVTGGERWKAKKSQRFFDYRPFTRFVIGFKALLSMKDYILINQMEGEGAPRKLAEEHVRWLRERPGSV